ncbi:AMP-binding protein [Mycolicibacterium sp.]|uniref:AMP-binding protein n=1 Tax=Mycolicibacterium sp. TaxID=2320850 RepID=UPI0028B05664|nr:AMP-binding protein [Mycolicibacterium sp.]
MSEYPPGGTIASRLEFWCRSDPSAPAIGGGDGAMLTRAELADLMARGRRILRGAGLGPADRVAILAPEGFDAAIATLQVAGACSAAPIRPSMGASGWAAPLGWLSPTALVASREWADVRNAASALGIRVFDPLELRAACSTWTTELTSGEPDVLLATSGSTGPPKWVRIPQRRMVAGSTAMSRCMELTSEDRSLLALPLNHAHGLASGLLLPLLSGGSVVVEGRFDPGSFLDAITAHAVTWFTAAPAMHRALVEQHATTPLSPGHRLRLVRSGTVSLSPALIDSLAAIFGVRVIEAYGMTECPHITCNPIGSPRAGSVGRPIVEQLSVVDSAGAPVPTGEWGQVVLRGSPLMTGYLDSAAHGQALRGGWLETGDEGRLDADGYLYLRGRITERLNRGGAIVAPAEVDAALLIHPAVREAVSFGVPHVSLGDDLAAAVVLASGHTADEAELRRYLAGRLEPRQVPSRIVAVDEIPVGEAGKVARGSMARLLNGVLYDDYEPGRGPVEETVIGLFETVLDSRLPRGYKVGRLTNFYLAGGDSLAAMQFMTCLSRAGWGERPPTLLVEHPTPAAVAMALATAPESAPHPSSGAHLVTVTGEGRKAPLIVMHGQGGQLFHYVDLAAALAPERPVLGLQAARYSAAELSLLTVEELAARYADEIVKRPVTGPIPLVGYSAAGWYAYAVAAALMQRGAEIGMCAMLDSHALRRSAMFNQLPRIVRLQLLAMKVLERPPAGQRQREHLSGLVHRALNRWQTGDPHGFPAGPACSEHPFMTLLRNYRPPRLSITVDLFGPERTMGRLRLAWRYYASEGVRCHPMFDEHTDLIRPGLMPRLAGELESTIARFTP